MGRSSILSMKDLSVRPIAERGKNYGEQADNEERKGEVHLLVRHDAERYALTQIDFVAYPREEIRCLALEHFDVSEHRKNKNKPQVARQFQKLWHIAAEVHVRQGKNDCEDYDERLKPTNFQNI